MKPLILAVIAAGIAITSSAQADTADKQKADTIKIGGMVIIRKGDKSDTSRNRNITFPGRKRRPSNLSTNWWVLDIGFANLNDHTNYSAATSQGFIAPGMTADNFNLRSGKSVNVNIWVFMQKLNMIKHVLNLKYGVGVELNNYRFDDERIQINKNPTRIALNQDYKGIRKNKLAADYVTVPMMLNLNFTPGREKGFGVSGGLSAGYLYSARQKVKIGDDKNKTHGNFDLRKWKLSYIGELNLGPAKLYGSYALKSMWEKGLDQTPYNVGIRFGRW